MGDWWLIEMLRRSDLGELDAFVHDDVRFRSPYADYAGRANVTHMVRLIARVLDDVRTSGMTEPETTTTTRTTRFTARVHGAPVQGVLCEDLDASGRLTEAMLLLRPYRELRAAMQSMRELLDAAPLPGVGA